MPLRVDQQPLVPPALKRISQELQCHTNRPDLRLGRENPVGQVIHDLDDDHELTTGGVGSVKDECYNTVNQAEEKHSIKKEPGKTPRSPTRTPRSSLHGLIYQFSQLQMRKPALHRLSLAVGSIFGRMCSRRREMPSSRDNVSDYHSDSSDADELGDTATSGVHGPVKHVDLGLSDTANTTDGKHTFKDDTCIPESAAVEYGFSSPIACSSVLGYDLTDITCEEDADDNTDDDHGEGEGDAYDEKDIEIKLDRSKRGTGGSSFQKPEPELQRRARWTMLSPISMLRALRAKSNGFSKPVRTSSPTEGTQRRSWGRLVFPDLTEPAEGTSSPEDSCVAHDSEKSALSSTPQDILCKNALIVGVDDRQNYVSFPMLSYDDSKVAPAESVVAKDLCSLFSGSLKTSNTLKHVVDEAGRNSCSNAAFEMR